MNLHDVGYYFVAAIVCLIMITIIWKRFRVIAEPNEALIISGLRNKGNTAGYFIVTGSGVFVKPLLQTVRKLSLRLREAEVSLSCFTQQGIQVGIEGVCIYKVGNDEASIVNAAQRFLGQDDRMDVNLLHLIEGHTRGIAGSLTFEEILRDSEALSNKVRSSMGPEVSKLGLQIDSLQFKKVLDPTHYIELLSKPHLAAVEQQARTAQANENQVATLAEQAAISEMEKAKRDTGIQVASMRAEVQKQEATSAQQGPLAAAYAEQEVIKQQTEIEKLHALKAEQYLLVTVRKPAEAAALALATAAEGQKKATIFQAEADAAKVELHAVATANAQKLMGAADASAKEVVGLAEGAAIKAKLMAEADGLAARAKALATESEATINLKIADQMTQIVAALAAPFGNIDNLMVLDGAEGLSKGMASIAGSAVTILPIIRQAMAAFKKGQP